MANARKCDMCGKFYTTDNEYAVITLTKYNEDEFQLERSYYDICTECIEWILQPKEKQPKGVTCAICDVPDLNCHEQCKEK